jgi:uncharacterized membrane protein YfcA
MTAAFPTDQLVPLTVALLLAGGVTGILAGLFGVGGGAIIVPILYQTFTLLSVPDEVRMPLTMGTSLAIIIPTSIRSYLTHRPTGAVDARIMRLWALPIFFGVTAGSLLAAFAPGWLFKIVFAAIAGANGIALLIGRKDWRIADEPGAFPMRLIGFAIGLFSSLMGISGGMLSNMTLMMFGRTIHQAVATSAGLGIIIAIPGAIGYMLAGIPKISLLPPFSIGFVSLLGFALLAPLGMLLAPIGARIAHAISRRRLEVAFGCYLVLMASRFIVNLL